MSSPPTVANRPFQPLPCLRPGPNSGVLIISLLLSVPPSPSIHPSISHTLTPSITIVPSFTALSPFDCISVYNQACWLLHLFSILACEHVHNCVHGCAFAAEHLFVNPVSINIVFTVSVSLRSTDVCPSKRLGHQLKWCSDSQSRIILCSISVGAWEPKSLHKLHCYLGHSSVSKHMVDLEPQLPTFSAAFVLYMCVHIHTQTNAWL